MAMRQRAGGIGQSRPRAAVNPVYENFKPISEWKEGESSHILLVYLPGFTKDNIRVQTQNANTIRVEGERQAPGNRRHRLLEDFPIPQNCNILATRAKFEAGTLTITIPKTSIAPPPPPPPPRPVATSKIEAKTTQQAPKPDSAKQIDDKTTLPPAPNAQTAASEPLGVTSTIPKVPTPNIGGGEKQTNGKSLSEAPTTPKDLQNETSLIAATSKMPDKVLEKTVEKEKETSEKSKESVKAEDVVTKTIGKEPGKSSENIVPETAKGEPSESKIIPEKALEKMVENEKERSGQKSKESIKAHKNVVAKETEKRSDTSSFSAHEEKAKAYSDDQKAKETKDVTTGSGSKLDNYKQAVNGLNERRQLIVNMGVAALVIVALGVYISYRYGSSGKPTN
ncbi:hypothetical protein F0562_029537 [Nyssa sinensis]|uniref:SHSP domain-containing protein n=1 Tax=Nyssa sinensis TaxID=561372 RepID=A0A5J5B302_9ASTE|nr:hypothetical protein F0562_029537 [Nyssa sinensis]